MTKHAQLTAVTRTIVGNKVKTLRRENIVPGVVYSKTFPSTPIQLSTREFLNVYKTAGVTNVIDLSIDGKVTPCLVHDLSIHPYKRTVRHIDFLAVNLKEKITTNVPLVIINEAPGVKELGGVLNVTMDEIEVEALPDDMPQDIKIDVSTLVTFDDAIYVSDLLVGNKFKIIEEPDTLIANLTSQSVETEEETPVTVVEEGVVEEDKKPE